MVTCWSGRDQHIARVDHAIAVGIMDHLDESFGMLGSVLSSDNRAASWPGASILTLYTSNGSLRLGDGVSADEILECGVGRTADIAGGLQRIAGVVGGDAQ